MQDESLEDILSKRARERKKEREKRGFKWKPFNCETRSRKITGKDTQVVKVSFGGGECFVTPFGLLNVRCCSCKMNAQSFNTLNAVTVTDDRRYNITASHSVTFEA